MVQNQVIDWLRRGACPASAFAYASYSRDAFLAIRFLLSLPRCEDSWWKGGRRTGQEVGSRVRVLDLVVGKKRKWEVFFVAGGG